MIQVYLHFGKNALLCSGSKSKTRVVALAAFGLLHQPTNGITLAKLSCSENGGSALFQKSVNITRLHGMTVVFIVTAVKTWKPHEIFGGNKK
jgi:hypothetical protein